MTREERREKILTGLEAIQQQSEESFEKESEQLQQPGEGEHLSKERMAKRMEIAQEHKGNLTALYNALQDEHLSQPMNAEEIGIGELIEGSIFQGHTPFSPSCLVSKVKLFQGKNRGLATIGLGKIKHVVDLSIKEDQIDCSMICFTSFVVHLKKTKAEEIGDRIQEAISEDRTSFHPATKLITITQNPLDKREWITNLSIKGITQDFTFIEEESGRLYTQDYLFHRVEIG